MQQSMTYRSFHQFERPQPGYALAAFNMVSVHRWLGIPSRSLPIQDLKRRKYNDLFGGIEGHRMVLILNKNLWHAHKRLSNVGDQ